MFTLMTKNLLSSHKVIKITCGNAHCLALTNKGVVYSWGNNDSIKINI